MEMINKLQIPNNNVIPTAVPTSTVASAPNNVSIFANILGSIFAPAKSNSSIGNNLFSNNPISNLLALAAKFTMFAHNVALNTSRMTYYNNMPSLGSAYNPYSYDNRRSEENHTENKDSYDNSKHYEGGEEENYVYPGGYSSSGNRQSSGRVPRRYRSSGSSGGGGFVSSVKKNIDNIKRGVLSAAEKVFSGGKDAVAKFTGDAGRLANKLNGQLKGGLRGKGTAIVAAAKRNGIDPATFASIIAFESGWGKYTSKNNCAGLMKGKKKIQFKRIEDCLDRAASNLKKNYFNKGLTTVSKIGRKYCPVGASNDPNGTNGEWIPAVSRIRKKLAS
ncbi:MAG: hypothetical protein PHC64_10670 [Candidatus Gastranaerophilales bacterium]|nr:hypothetical protein [Candidatus Gastranaerophilales bacterium]